MKSLLGIVARSFRCRWARRLSARSISTSWLFEASPSIETPASSAMSREISWRRRRRDARSVRHTIRIGCETISFRANRLARHITRADDHRKHEFIRPVFILKSLDVTNRDLDLFAGKDVRDRLREDVRPLLIEETCSLTIRPGSFINRLRF